MLGQLNKSLAAVTFRCGYIIAHVILKCTIHIKPQCLLAHTKLTLQSEKSRVCVKETYFVLGCHVPSVPHPHPMAVRSFPVSVDTAAPICSYLLTPVVAPVYFCLQLYHNYVYLSISPLICSFTYSFNKQMLSQFHAICS